MKILVISFAGIGDSLLATPLIRALRDHFPAATIDVFVMWAGSKDLLEGNPCIQTIHQQNFLKESTVANVRFLWRLRKLRYDISINTYPQSKIQYRIIAKIINASKRLSHGHENHCRLDDWLTNLSIDQDYGIHCIENNLNLLKRLDGARPVQSLEPEIFFSAAENLWAEDFLRKSHLEERTLAAIHVGSGKTKNLILKRWPVEHYIELIQKLIAAEPGLTVLLFGGPEEKDDNEAILQAIPSPQVMAVPSRTIKQAAALLKHCDLFLSVDNAFMHLAATVKVPRQIVIESPTFNKTIEPYHRPFRLVKNPMVAGRNLDYYRYDGRDIQGGRQHLLACMRSISPEAVLREVQSALAERQGVERVSKQTPEVRTRISFLSLEEYHRLDEFNENGRRTELIRGIVIEKMPKSPLHSSLGKRLYDKIAAMASANFVVQQEDPITLADSEPEPDISVVRGAEADFVSAHPTTAELVVEVAVSSAALDRENASLYAEAGVKEYWIVLGPERKVEVYGQPEGGRYQETRLLGLNDTLECRSIPTVRIRVAELFG